MNRSVKPVLTLAAVLACVGVAAAAPSKADPKQVARGKYLVTLGGCNDCHTPWKMGPNGPAPDMTRQLSGHPAEAKVDAAPALGMPWMSAWYATNTAVAGPWGVSFARNLTPDKETGTGGWTEKDFIQTIRTGKRMGHGRPLLPPMPWPNYAEATDEDLKAIFAYLQSIPAVKNAVQEPIPPAAMPAK
ncbi:MAG: c-type cytochrome [Anaeromyxobacteraceae bacterium]